MPCNHVAVRLEPVDEVPVDADVGHYDELDEELKQRVAAVVSDGRGSTHPITDRAAVRAFEDCRFDVIKFTRYFAIERS